MLLWFAHDVWLDIFALWVGRADRACALFALLAPEEWDPPVQDPLTLAAILRREVVATHHPLAWLITHIRQYWCLPTTQPLPSWLESEWLLCDALSVRRDDLADGVALHPEYYPFYTHTARGMTLSTRHLSTLRAFPSISTLEVLGFASRPKNRVLLFDDYAIDVWETVENLTLRHFSDRAVTLSFEGFPNLRRLRFEGQANLRWEVWPPDLTHLSLGPEVCVSWCPPPPSTLTECRLSISTEEMINHSSHLFPHCTHLFVFVENTFHEPAFRFPKVRVLELWFCGHCPFLSRLQQHLMAHIPCLEEMICVHFFIDPLEWMTWLSEMQSVWESLSITTLRLQVDIMDQPFLTAAEIEAMSRPFVPARTTLIVQ